LKKMLVPALLILLVIPSVAGCGASGSSSPPAPASPMSYTPNPGGARFDFALFQQVVSADYSANAVLSPLSLELALAMVYNGATGQIKTEIARALDVEGQSLDQVNASFMQWLSRLKQLGTGVQVDVANSLWANQELRVYDDYIDTCRQSYEAEAASVDYADPSTVDRINTWVNDKTHGRISSVLDRPLNTGDLLELVTAVSFDGSWTYGFDESQTQPGDFHLLDGSVSQVPMMRQSGKYEYFENDRYQAVALPYGEYGQYMPGGASMYIFLPREGISYEDFLKGLQPDYLEPMQFQRTEGEIVLPRFRVEYGTDLKDAMMGLGMTSTFSGGGFGGVGPDGDQYWLGEAVHKTYIDVNEQGTEAAAASEINMTKGIDLEPFAPFRLEFNRPFFFALVVQGADTPLFMGSIVNPVPM